MGLAARRRGAYGGEYLWAELRLRARGKKRLAKELVKLEQNGATKQRWWLAVDPKSSRDLIRCLSFYSRSYHVVYLEQEPNQNLPLLHAKPTRVEA
jgi:hypothetical protein